MANQIEVPKLVEHIYIAPPADNITVTKLVMYVFAMPGEGEDTSTSQGHVHTQIIVRAA